MAARPQSATRRAVAGVRSSTEFLERGGMVGSGQYGLTTNAASGANTVPLPAPLVLPHRPGSPPAVTSLEAVPSPGGPSVNTADLRAMVRALDESHDEASPKPNYLGMSDASASLCGPGDAPTPSSPRRVSIAPLPPPVAAPAPAAGGVPSPRANNWLEAAYSPRVSAGGGPAAVAPDIPRSPGSSPIRQRSFGASSVGAMALGVPTSPRMGVAGPVSEPAPVVAAGPSGGGSEFATRPKTPLQTVYGRPPSVAPDADEVLRAITSTATPGFASAALLPEALRPQYVTTSPPVAAVATAATVTAPGVHGGGCSPRRGSSAARNSSGGGTGDAAAPSVASPTHSKLLAAYGAGVGPSAAAPEGRPSSRASPSSSPSPAPSPSSSSRSLATTTASTPRSTAPPSQRPPSAAVLAREAYGHGASGGAAGSSRHQGSSVRHSPEPTSSKPGSATGGAAVNGRGPPLGGDFVPWYGPGVSRAGLHSAGEYQGPAAAAESSGAQAGGGGQRGGKAGRNRREELFEEEDPAVVLEQSIALLSEIEALIRSSVDLPPDRPLDSVGRDTALGIPAELLEALEDTLEVIEMAREEIAANAEREQQQRGRNGAGPRAPVGGSGRPMHGGQRSGGPGAGAYGATGGGSSGCLSRSGSRDAAGLGDERSARGSWTGSAGSGCGAGSTAQYLPPISSSTSVGSRASSAYGSPSSYSRPSSHGPGPSVSRSPSQKQQHQPSASQQPPRSNSASRRVSHGSLSGGSGGGGSTTSIPSLAAKLSRNRAWHKETPPEEWVSQKQQRAEAERRRREAQLAADLKYLQQIRSRASEVQQTHEALLAQAEEGVRAARNAKATSEAQHRWLQYQETVAEGARRHHDALLSTPPGSQSGASSYAYSTGASYRGY